MFRFIINIILCFIAIHGVAQNFLNGSFEINTAVNDQINIPNTDFNGFMSNTIAYGTFGNMDIVTSSTYCNGPQSGNWFVSLTGGETDAITMELSQPLVAGQNYEMSFWDRACTQFSVGTMPVTIGVSNTQGTTGTIVYTAPMPTEGQWVQRIFSFTAPVSGSFISVTLVSNPTGTNTSMWAHVDNFVLTGTVCPLSINLGNDQSICAGGSVLLDATLDGAGYVWQDGSTAATYNVTGSGTYHVTATIDACVYTDTINITAIPPIVIELGQDTTICPGDQVVYDITTPGATYLWHDGSTLPTYTASVAEQINVVVSIGQCSASDSANLGVINFTPVDLGQDISVCEGESITLDAGISPYTYQWQDGSTAQTYVPLTSGLYSVDYSNGICTGTDQINVTFIQPPAFQWEEDSILICFNQPETLVATTPGATYLWSDGSIGNQLVVTQAGSYDVTVTVNGCSVSDTIVTEVIPAEFIILESSLDCLDGTEPTLLTDLNQHSDLVWNNGETGSSIVAEISGIYIATLQTPCETISSTIVVSDCAELHFYMPNAITPNGDGINDVLMPGLYINFQFDSYEFVILNRFGEPVFKTNDIHDVWDGGHTGSRTYVRDDVYIWRMTLNYGGNSIEKSGHIAIVR